MSVLELNHVKKSFNNGKLQVLQDISLSVEKGEVVAISGPSSSKNRPNAGRRQKIPDTRPACAGIIAMVISASAFQRGHRRPRP